MPQVIEVEIPVWMFERLSEVSVELGITVEEAALIFWSKGGTHPAQKTEAA